jgi:hypothetical protein
MDIFCREGDNYNYNYNYNYIYIYKKEWNRNKNRRKNKWGQPKHHKYTATPSHSVLAQTGNPIAPATPHYTSLFHWLVNYVNATLDRGVRPSVHSCNIDIYYKRRVRLRGGYCTTCTIRHLQCVDFATFAFVYWAVSIDHPLWI